MSRRTFFSRLGVIAAAAAITITAVLWLSDLIAPEPFGLVGSGRAGAGDTTPALPVRTEESQHEYAKRAHGTAVSTGAEARAERTLPLGQVAETQPILDMAALDRLRFFLATKDPALLANASEISELLLACQRSMSFKRSQRFAGSQQTESTRIAAEVWARHCPVDQDPEIEKIQSEFIEFKNQLRSEFALAWSLAGYGDEEKTKFTTPELERLATSLLLSTRDYDVVRLALQAFSTERPRGTHHRARLPYLEQLPGMGGINDYRSYRFLDLVGLLVRCMEQPTACGPDSLLAIQGCFFYGRCFRGISVRDNLVAMYAPREIHAATVAASRIVDARRAHRASTLAPRVNRAGAGRAPGPRAGQEGRH